MEDFTPIQKSLIDDRQIDTFLMHLETTQMVRSYKMITLLTMLNADVFPGEMGIDDLVKGFARLAGRSARLRKDVSVSLDDHRGLKRLIEENPIQAWIGGRGTGGVQYSRRLARCKD
jgi:hypothetical protein